MFTFMIILAYLVTIATFIYTIIELKDLMKDLKNKMFELRMERILKNVKMRKEDK